MRVTLRDQCSISFSLSLSRYIRDIYIYIYTSMYMKSGHMIQILLRHDILCNYCWDMCKVSFHVQLRPESRMCFGWGKGGGRGWWVPPL